MKACNIAAGLIGVCVAWAAPGVAQQREMVTFSSQWPREVVASPADVSFLNDGPAGGKGLVRVEGGHFVDGAGKRVRFWGVNFSGKAVLPEQADAPIIAAHLARLGVNCVRLHFFDRPFPNGVIDPSRGDTQHLDDGALDRLDTFVFELKKRGVYTDLNLNVARAYKKGDGVKDAELLGFAKALTHYDPRIIELEKAYAKALLAHRNRHTGNEYREEPAVALVELLNENSLAEAWFNGRLEGKNARRNPGTWADIPASYAEDLTRRYNEWLAVNVPPRVLAKVRQQAGVSEGQPVPRLGKAEIAKAPDERFHAEARFYIEVERQFATEMGRFLKEEVGVKHPLILNSDHSHYGTGYPQLSAISLLDVVDGHVYWQHPKYLEEGGRRRGFEIENTAMVDQPLQSSVVQLSRSAMAGKPFTVSEVGHPFPAEWSAEGIPVLAAYAALQDWDGVFWYTMTHESLLNTTAATGHFDLAPDPVKVAQLPAGALMFRRGDVKAAKELVERAVTPRQVEDSIRMSNKERPFYTEGWNNAWPLEHRVRISSLDAKQAVTPQASAEVPEPIRSDTGEIEWHHGGKQKGLVVVDAEGSAAIVGFSRASAADTKHLAVRVENAFCAVTLSALDQGSIAKANRLLLTAGSRAGNTDMKWNAQRTSLESWGKAPTLIEPVRGSVTLKDLDGAKAVEFQPLDGAGRAMGTPVRARQANGGWELPLGQTATTWYTISVTR